MLKTFFLTNMTEIYFIYGLSFFIMGIAILLGTRQKSNLVIARSLWLLSVFGFLHGISEWGYFYLPYKMPLLSPEGAQFLEILEFGITGLSFAFLMVFGFKLLADVYDIKYTNYLFYLSIIISTSWFLYFIVYRVFIIGENLNYWLLISDIFSRYFLCLPGGLAAAYAVFKHKKRIKLFRKTNILLAHNLLVISFAAYSLLAGAIVPKASIFPANIINTESFFQWATLPVPLFRTLFCLLITVSILMVLKVFQLEREVVMKKITSENAVLNERERIKKDLHDGIIQSLFALGLQLKNTNDYLQSNQSAAKHRIALIVDSIDHIMDDLRMYIMDLKYKELADLTLPDLIQKAKSKFNTSVDIIIYDNNKLEYEKDISSEAKIHLYHILVELLSNIHKHASASRIELNVAVKNGYYHLSVQDNGRGIGLTEKKEGKINMGLQNIKERISMVNGFFYLDNNHKEGIKFCLAIPLEETSSI